MVNPFAWFFFRKLLEGMDQAKEGGYILDILLGLAGVIAGIVVGVYISNVVGGAVGVILGFLCPFIFGGIGISIRDWIKNIKNKSQ